MKPRHLFTWWVLGLLWGVLGGSLAAQQVLPYRCGFVLESEAAIREVYGPELAVLNLQPGDVIADVGGSNGYRMGMFATLVDGLDIYVQDIDTLCLNEQELGAVQQYYAGLNGAPLTARFHKVIGTETKTGLPERTMDKVLVTAAYHHFSDPKAIFGDLAATLKPDGKIYLIENVVRRDGQKRRRLCDDPLLSEQSLKAALTAQGMRVVAVHSLGRWWTKMFVLQPMEP